MSGCGVCGASPLLRVLDLRDHFGRPTWLGRCPACGLVQACERPSNDELERYYSEYCYAHDSAWVVPEATVASLDRLAAGLARYRQNNRCLDVGCGAGAILAAMARHGWQAEGTELSEVAADRLEAQGFRIHRGAVEELRLPADRYDVVLLSEVIEHLRAPRSALENVASALRPGGAAYLTTPNFQSLSRRLLGERWRVISVPEHLYYFAPGSLRRLLRSVGLAPARLWTEGLDPYQLRAGLRRPQRPSDAALAEAHSGAETLREQALRRPWLRAAKAAANLGLRLTRLGDTLKCVAARG